MKIIIERIWELLEESSGEAYESLEERKENILGQISSCEEELTDLHELLAGYSYDMQNVIAPVYRDRTMVVDRNDIWFNMQSILRACDRIASMVYNVNVPWFGTTYTAFAEDEVKKKERKYYNRLEEVREKIQRKYQDSIAGYKDELVKLYENKVVVYENTDDVYASKVSRDYYPKYTSPGEEVVNILEWLGDAVTGFTGGVIEGVIGVIDGIGEFLFGIGEFAISECVVLVNKGMGSEPPDWAVKNVEETKAQIGAILDEPMLLIEGMAQGVSDTYESEGIWYCAGYAVGTYAGTKGIAELGKEVKGKVGVKGKVESGSETTLQTGGRQIDYNAYIKRLETIDTEYENIRIDTTDISKIAKNTGIPEWKINRVKEHIFYNEHTLDSGVKRFDADPEIADTWYRLKNGTYNQNDIDLLNHEYFESKFESFYKTDYRTAHNKTEETGRIWDPYKEE